jgi:hypothetical protein
VNAQSNGFVVGGKWANQISISDVNGRPFQNRYADVAGTPCFIADYKFGNIVLAQGRTFVNVQMKIDLVSQETRFVSSNGVEGYISAGMVKEIKFADTTAEGIIQYTFRTGFPAIDKQNENNFYQVLADGKCGFVKSISKKVNERKSELSGEIAKDFETTENYYLFIKGEMKRIKKDKDFFATEFADKKAEVSLFIQSNKLNVKNNDHVIKLVNYYNSL